MCSVSCLTCPNSPDQMLSIPFDWVSSRLNALQTARAPICPFKGFNLLFVHISICKFLGRVFCWFHSQCMRSRSADRLLHWTHMNSVVSVFLFRSFLVPSHVFQKSRKKIRVGLNEYICWFFWYVVRPISHRGARVHMDKFCYANSSNGIFPWNIIKKKHPLISLHLFSSTTKSITCIGGFADRFGLHRCQTQKRQQTEVNTILWGTPSRGLPD